jgi:hypothetical protein
MARPMSNQHTIASRMTVHSDTQSSPLALTLFFLLIFLLFNLCINSKTLIRYVRLLGLYQRNFGRNSSLVKEFSSFYSNSLVVFLDFKSDYFY